MEFNLMKDSVNLCETVFGGSGECAVDCDITLPEYLPDMVRILKCSCIPNIQSHRVNGDRLTVECDCKVRTLYICEENKIRCHEQNIHFSKQIELKSGEIPTDYFVGARTDYVNYRVSGQRRFEIHGAVTIFAKGYGKKKCEMVMGASGDGIACKCENHNACNLVCLVEKAFNVSETCDAGVLDEPIGAIISSCGYGIIDEIKTVNDKLFLKAQLILHTTFTGAESCEVQTLENIVNINQIIEAPDINENCQIDSHLTVTGLEVKPRFDSAGNKNLLDVSATLNLSAYCYENKNITAIRDAYSVKYETDCKKSVIYLSSLKDKIEDTFLCRGVADLNNTGVSKVLSLTCPEITSAFSLTEDSACVNGEVTVEIIYEDIKGEVCFAHRNVPYEYKKTVENDGAILTCRPNCTISAHSYIISDSNTLDIRIEINVRGFIFSENEKLIITDLTINKDKPKTIKTASLTVYFCEKGEQLWNIAERYNTTVDAIMRENKMTDSTVKEKCKLLIPKM